MRSIELIDEKMEKIEKRIIREVEKRVLIVGDYVVKNIDCVTFKIPKDEEISSIITELRKFRKGRMVSVK